MPMLSTVQPAVPEYIQEDSFTNAMLRAGNSATILATRRWSGKSSSEQGRNSVNCEEEECTRLRTIRMLTWVTHQDEYLDEIRRLNASTKRANGSGLFVNGVSCSDHTVLLTHWDSEDIKEWNGTFFERRALKDLGLVELVVIDVTGVHNVNVNYCLCDSKIERWGSN
ncbi:hypothetical protein B0H14DRAFT_3443821 [Mycena olivaceomarginata]|nr:hypothetical protein B0H14DRAFT_3443821 [Mycena olivaceomarginata]